MTRTYTYPLIYNSATSTIEQMDSDGLERLSYNLRYAYGQQLNGYNHGSLAVGASQPGHVDIGSLQDTKAQIATNVNERNLTGGTDYPAYPTTLDVTDVGSAFEYEQQFSTIAAFSTGSALDSDSVLFYNLTDSGDASSNDIISVTDSDHLKGILSHTLHKMYIGDKVGTYEVSTSTPSDGGTWIDKGTWFTDTTYSAGTTTYKYYLKTAATAPGTVDKPLGLAGNDASTLQERLIAHDGNLIQKVLLPALNRRVKRSECLRYHVATSPSAGDIAKGTFSDTRTTTGDQEQGFGGDTADPEGEASSTQYWRTLTPDGSATAQTTKTLFLKPKKL